MIRCGLLGATGMVGQHYVALLQDHPWFKLTFLAASEKSRGLPYLEAISEWYPSTPCNTPLTLTTPKFDEIAQACDLVFSCLEGERALENRLAEAGLYVISHNASHRQTKPIIIPEINAHAIGEHKLIAKPNCSIQSYVIPLAPLRKFGIKQVMVTTLQSQSGAGRAGMARREVIPYIAGEEGKSIFEPQKVLERSFEVSATCIRVPIPYGHLATVSVAFSRKPTRDEILKAWESFPGLDLPSAPKQPIHICQEKDRPQPYLDAWQGEGMVVSVGRLRPCSVLDWQFVGLSHNVIRGAAGGGLLAAEALIAANKSNLAHSI